MAARPAPKSLICLAPPEGGFSSSSCTLGQLLPTGPGWPFTFIPQLEQHLLPLPDILNNNTVKEGPDKVVNKYKDLEGPKDQCRNRDEGNFQLTYNSPKQ